VINHPILFQRKQPIDRLPNLRRRVCVVDEEAPCRAVSAFVEMARQNYDGLFGCRRHVMSAFVIKARRLLLVAFGVIDGGADVIAQQPVVFFVL
jgi:hypothetical protein